MSNDGENIGAVNLDSMLTVWDNKGNIMFTVKTGYNFVNKNQIFRFTKDNKILAISNDKDADLIDINGNIIQSFSLHKGSVNAVDISDDGKFIATASSDSTINVWYLNSDQQRFEIYNTLTPHHDTVWSVDFARNNRYLVSASAEGKLIVTNINNEGAYNFGGKFYNSNYDRFISIGFQNLMNQDQEL
jgi:WD40 repeat protein